MIIEQTYRLILERYGNQIRDLTISGVTIGTYLTAVRLSDDSTGTSATLADNHPFHAKRNRDFGDFTPLRIRGQSVADLLSSPKDTGAISSLKIAALNAVSGRLISNENYRIEEDKDPIEFTDLTSQKQITIVGAFNSYIRRISATGNILHILEINRNLIPDEFRKYFVPDDEYGSVLPGSDIVIITGQTLVNGTIDSLLEAITPGTQVIITGPSSSILPEVLFENKVSIVGAVRITDPELLFDVVSQGGTGFHLFEYCAKKICILKKDERPVK
jgi:uncharacterized protein (DUF4213/DUF364 family)